MARENKSNRPRRVDNIERKMKGLGFTQSVDPDSLPVYATEQWVEDKNYLTEHQDISGKQDSLIEGKNITIEENVISANVQEVPIGAIIQSSVDISSENFKLCDGSWFTKPVFIKYYAYTGNNSVYYIKKKFITPPDIPVKVQVYQYKNGNMVEHHPEILQYMQTNGYLFINSGNIGYACSRDELQDKELVVSYEKPYPDLPVTKVKFYRLCNLTRSTYDDDGNITFRFFHNDLWTTDPNICKKKNPDLNNLYRRLRYLDKDSPSPNIASSYISSTIYPKAYNFITVQENITMKNGVIESESGFYDGKYRVELTEYVEKEIVEGNGWYYYNNYDFKDIKGLSSTKIEPHSTGGGYYIEGAVQQKPKLYVYSADETDHKISDNGWLTCVNDGKHLTFGEYENGVWTPKALTHKLISTSETESAFTLIFDIITPPAFIAGRDIFYGYRSLILRISDTTGKLNIYMAGYNSSGLKWRVSNKFTGFTLKPNRKYRLYLDNDGYKADSTSTGAVAHSMYIYEYNELETYLDSLDNSISESTYFEVYTNYQPYNYYNSYGIRTMYHADASAWTEGQFIDLLSFRCKHISDTTYQNYGGEFRAAKLSYQEPSDNGLALPRITGNDGGEYYIRVK